MLSIHAAVPAPVRGFLGRLVLCGAMLALVQGARCQVVPQCDRVAVGETGKVRIVDGAGKTIVTIPASGFPETTVTALGPRFVVIDDSGTRIFDRDGNQKGGTIPKTGTRQSVEVSGERIIVTDSDRVRIFDADGNQKGGDIPKVGTGRQIVMTCGERVIVIDDDRVRVYDKDGNKKSGDIVRGGTHRQDVVLTPDRIIVIDDNSVRVLDKDGNAKSGAIQNPGQSRQQVVADGDRIVIVEYNDVRIFDKDGNTVAGPIQKSGQGRQRVILCGERVLVLDDMTVRVYDRDGKAVSGPIQTKAGYTVEAGNDRIVIIEDDKVRIFDKSGNAVGGPILKTGMVRQQVRFCGDRIVVIDESLVRVLYHNGTQLQQIPLVPTGEQYVMVVGDRIIVVERDQVRIFDKDGKQQGGAIARTGANQQSVVVAGDRILVVDDDRVRIFDRSGNKLGNDILTSERASVAGACTTPSTFQAIGNGCAGSNGVLKQTASGLSTVGHMVAYQAGNGPKGGKGRINLGVSDQSWAGAKLPLDLGFLGAPGCTVYNEAVIAVGVSYDAQGNAAVSFTIPVDMNLVGLRFFTQFEALDAAANRLGLVTSNGMETVVGSQL